MAWLTPPVFTTGEVAASTDLNAISGDLAVLAEAVGLYGISGSLVGSPPAGIGSPWGLIQPGTEAAVTTGAGILVINFANTFPNGLATIVANNGDNSAVANLHFDFIASTYSASGCQAVVWNDASTVISTLVRCNYIAVGF